MSFSSELLDCYDIAKKRASYSIDITKSFGSFIKNYGEAQKECSKKMIEFLHKSKKEYAAKMDYSVQEAMTSLIDNLEAIYSAQSSIVDQLLEQKKEIDAFAKEIEKKQKTIAKDAESTEKVWNTQLEALKKARANYVKLGKEAQSLTEALEKKKLDPKIKPDAISQMQSKTSAAIEKRDQADNQYKTVLEETNGKMETYYSSDQPQVLSQYQEFEESRIRFMKDNFSKLIDTISSSNISSIFDSSCSQIKNQVSSIDIDGDISNWALANGKHYAIPEAMPYLTYDVECSCTPDLSTNGRKPNDSGDSAPRRAPPAHPQPSSSSSTYKSKKSTFDPSVYTVSERDPSSPRFATAVKNMLKTVDNDTKKMKNDLAALEKLLPMYNKDPSGKAAVEAEIEEIKKNLDTLDYIHHDLEDALADSEAGSSAGTQQDNGGYTDNIPATAIYDYSASNDTELSFNEGDSLTILQKDDSGWWYASYKGREGFVPANYVKI